MAEATPAVPKPPAAKPAAPAPKPTPAPSGRTTLADSVDVIRSMWYGDPGKGKTVDLASMAKLGKIIYVDAENRLKAGPLKRLGIPVENIEPVTNISYARLEDLSHEIGERLDKGEPIVGLAWDSATETARTYTQTLVDVGVVRAQRAGKERSSWSTELSDWGDMTEQMRRTIRRFRDLPIHLAISCLQNRDTDEEGNVVVSPALSPAVYRDFMGYMDVVIHCRVEQVGDVEEYSGQCRPFGRWVAKDSFGIMPKVLVNPSFDRVLQYINGELTSKTDPMQQEARARREAQADAEAQAAG